MHEQDSHHSLQFGWSDLPAAIKPFLFNFFTDKNIVRLPYPFRFLLASLIAHRRSKREAGDSYGLLGGASPLLANTQTQADALQTILGDAYRVFVCMRYWHPMADEVAGRVKDYNPDRIILLPLYPRIFAPPRHVPPTKHGNVQPKKIISISPRHCCVAIRAPRVLSIPRSN